MGNAKKTIGVGYLLSQGNYPPPTTQSHTFDNYVAGGGGPTTSLTEAMAEPFGGVEEHDACPRAKTLHH